MNRITLQIKNFQAIKEAKIDLEGLVVIGGENSSGKSTVGKILMSIIKTDNKKRVRPKIDTKRGFENYLGYLFDGDLNEDAEILVSKNSVSLFEIRLQEGRCIEFNSTYNNNSKRDFLDCTLIQTPFVWDLQDFFTDLARYQQNRDSDLFGTNISYPYALYDLYLKLTMQRLKMKPSPKIYELSEKISSIIGGTFTRNPEGKYYFFDGKKEVPLLSTASGIKSFGIIQNLIKHCYMTPYGYFVFDEPENHLHPTSQVEFARIIIELINEGINIMINTHSPYLLEAFQKLRERDKTQKINFYLAHNHIVEQIDGDNDKTLERIFSLLNHSFERIDQIDVERIHNNAKRI